MMGAMANVYEPEWDADRDAPPYVWKRARIRRQTGARQLGASLFELPPGAVSFPLHVHYANEELLVVLAGRPTLQTLTETRVLEPGEVVACPAGRDGAHRLTERQRRAGARADRLDDARAGHQRVPGDRRVLGARLHPRGPTRRTAPSTSTPKPV